MAPERTRPRRGPPYEPNGRRRRRGGRRRGCPRGDALADAARLSRLQIGPESVAKPHMKL